MKTQDKSNTDDLDENIAENGIRNVQCNAICVFHHESARSLDVALYVQLQ